MTAPSPDVVVVGNLTIDDFQPFDNGKPQLISKFSVESIAKDPAKTSESPARSTTAMNAPPPVAPATGEAAAPAAAPVTIESLQPTAEQNAMTYVDMVFPFLVTGDSAQRPS